MVGESSSPPTSFPPVMATTAVFAQTLHHASNLHEPSDLCSDVSSGMEWFTPASHYDYGDPYGTPYPSSTMASPPWLFPRSSVSEISLSGYATHHQTQQHHHQAATHHRSHTQHQHQQQQQQHHHHQQQQQQQQHQHQQQQQHQQHHTPGDSSLPMHPQLKDSNRPKSSPSTFGPALDMPWPTTDGLGIYPTVVTGGPDTPVSSSFTPALFPAFTDEPGTGTNTPLFSLAQPHIAASEETPEIPTPKPVKTFTNIAPNPRGPAVTPSSSSTAANAGGQRGSSKRKHSADDDESGQQAPGSTGKRRKRTPSIVNADLSEDDRFLVQLKEDENLPWKEISTRFQTEKGRFLNVAALQMRYKRLRERFRTWEEQDVKALRLATDYWEKYKWEIIAAKMLDYGVQDRWPPRSCMRKWSELENTDAAVAAAQTLVSSAGLTPTVSHFSSPVDPPLHFNFMPLQ